ncbi:transposase [Streptomyces sp. AA1529]|uniref:transposase n=1 Tax=Streptomyces sp. AA1529 TaxID=1203257 RepID=UPI003D706CEE
MNDGTRRRTRAGTPWRDVPDRYGPWERILEQPQVQADAQGLITRAVSVDWTACRAHRHAAGAQEKGVWRAPGGVGDTEPDDHGLGCSGGGLTTKIHLVVEQGRTPLSLLPTAGHRHDSPQFQPLLERIRVPRAGPGRLRHDAGQARADKACGSRANRSCPRRRRIGCTTPEKADRVRDCKKLGSRGGRATVFDKDDHKERHTVECGISRLKRNRAVATRYENSPSDTRRPCWSQPSKSGCDQRFRGRLQAWNVVVSFMAARPAATRFTGAFSSA